MKATATGADALESAALTSKQDWREPHLPNSKSLTAPAFPISSRVLRVAPGQHGLPVASFWKFWIEGNELYAMNRDANSMKISVHASGQIHLRLERRHLQLLAPPLPLAGSDWYHALEIRYLVAPDRFRPTPKKLKKKEKAYLIDVADRHALVLNLFVTSIAPPPPVPAQFGGAQILWATSLADRRQAALIARVMLLDRENLEHVARLRGADGPKVTFAGGNPASPSLELSHVFWGAGGNVVLIVPAGSETIRTLKPASSEVDSTTVRQPEVECESPSASVAVRAPNGAIVAELALHGEQSRVRLSKNDHVTTRLGQFQLKRFHENLLPGQRFELAPLSLVAIPSINGLRPLKWNYSIRCAYDGTNLNVSVHPVSVALQVDDSRPDGPLQAGEQIVVTAPMSVLTLSTSPDTSSVTVPLNSSLLLCDVVKT